MRSLKLPASETHIAAVPIELTALNAKAKRRRIRPGADFRREVVLVVRSDHVPNEQGRSQDQEATFLAICSAKEKAFERCS